MDGTTLRTGAVGALKGFPHPVSIAREVTRRLPHELLAGEGAARFAHEIGADTTENLIEDSRRVWQEWFDRTLTPEQKQAWPNIPLADLCRHAIDTRGDHKAAAVNGDGTNVYWLWEGTGEPRQCHAEPIALR